MGRLQVCVLLVTAFWTFVGFNTLALSQTSGSSLAIDRTVSGNYSSPTNSVKTQSFSTANADELLLAFVSTDSTSTNGNTVTSMNGAGLTWQVVARANGVLGDAEIWRAFTPAILSNVTVTANLARSAAASITVVAFTGADPSGSNGSGAVGATATFSAASGAPTGSVITTRDNSWVFGVGADWDKATARTLGPNQTMVHQYLATVNDSYWVQRQNSASSPAGTTVTINDTAPGTDRYNLALVEVLPAAGANTNPDFGLTISPSSQSVQAGDSASYTASITAINAFSDAINFSASGLPSGTTASFNPSSLSGPGTSQLTIGMAGSVAPGSYPFTVTATSGSLTHTVSLTLVVGAPVDFALAVTPSNQSVQPGLSVNYTASVTAQNGFSSATALSITGLPAGATAGFTPQSVSGSGTAQLTIDTSSATPAGTYPLTITGTSGALAHSAKVALTVSSSGSPSSLSIDTVSSADSSSVDKQSSNAQFSTTAPNELLLAFIAADSSTSGGNSVTSVKGAGLNWELVTRANRVLGDAEIWRTFAPTVLSNTTVTASLAQSAASSITVVAFAGADSSGSNGSGAIGATTIFSAASGAPTGSLTTTRDGSLVFAVGADWDNATARSVGPNQTMVHQYLSSVNDTYWLQRQNSASLPAGTPVTMNDTAPSRDKFNLATVEVLPANGNAVTTNADFSLTTSPLSQLVQVGKSTTYALTITGENGFSGAANLTASGLPSGATASFTPPSVSGSGTSQLTIDTTSSVAAGSYPFTVTASSGSLMHSVNLTLVVSAAADFSLALTPPNQSVQSGASVNYTATIAAISGYAAPTSLAVTGLPAGAKATFTPTSVTGSGSTQLAISTSLTTPAGTYPLTITASSGTLSHSASVTLVVGAAADFSLAVTPPSQSAQPGSNVNYTAIIAALNGYAAVTSFTATGLPAGAVVTFTPQAVTGSGSTQMAISTSSTTPAGSYLLTITASSGTLSHSVSATLVVSAAADFAITAMPSSQSIQPGASATYTVNITGQNGYSGVANLIATGLPSGATATFNPISVNGTGSSQLTVTTIGATPTGSYPLTITATNGSEVHNASVTLVLSAGVPHSVSLTWIDTDSGIVGYNVYRTNQGGTGYTKLNSSPVIPTSYADSTVQSGSTYFYVVTAVNTSGVESGFSALAQAVIP